MTIKARLASKSAREEDELEIQGSMNGKRELRLGGKGRGKAGSNRAEGTSYGRLSVNGGQMQEFDGAITSTSSSPILLPPDESRSYH